MLTHDNAFMTLALALVAEILGLTRETIARSCAARVLNRKLLSLVGDRAVKGHPCLNDLEFRGRPIVRLGDVLCSPHGVVPLDRPDRHKLKKYPGFRLRPGSKEPAAALRAGLLPCLDASCTPTS